MNRRLFRCNMAGGQQRFHKTMVFGNLGNLLRVSVHQIGAAVSDMGKNRFSATH